MMDHMAALTYKVLSTWSEVWSGSSRARASVMHPGDRSGQIFVIFQILGGLVIPITRQVCPTAAMDHMATLVYISKRIRAPGPRFGRYLGHQRRLLLLPGVSI